MDYLTLLLNTYINQKEIFSEAIQNRQKEIDKEKSISKKEFYFNCSKVIETLKSQIDEKFNKRKNELYLIIDLREAKGKPITDIQNELNTIHKNQFPINLLHLTGDKFRGCLYLNDIDFIENCINELQYISDKQKNELFKNTVFFYTSTHFNKDNLKGIFNKDFETKKDFVKNLYSENTRIFFRYAITLKNEDFIKSIQNEFKLFCVYNNATNEIKENWLKHTYQYIINVNELSGFISKTTVNMFIDWYNETIKTLSIEVIEKEQPKNKKSDFSVLEWATIFYYADSCKYFNQKTKTERSAFFMNSHKITTSTNTFKNKVIEANKTINKTNTYSIAKLNLIKPFIEKYYYKGVASLENDIEYLKNNIEQNNDY